jgi:hypothetical protein
MDLGLENLIVLGSSDEIATINNTTTPCILALTWYNQIKHYIEIL